MGLRSNLKGAFFGLERCLRVVRETLAQIFTGEKCSDLTGAVLQRLLIKDMLVGLKIPVNHFEEHRTGSNGLAMVLRSNLKGAFFGLARCLRVVRETLAHIFTGEKCSDLTGAVLECLLIKDILAGLKIPVSHFEEHRTGSNWAHYGFEVKSQRCLFWSRKVPSRRP